MEMIYFFVTNETYSALRVRFGLGHRWGYRLNYLFILIIYQSFAYHFDVLKFRHDDDGAGAESRERYADSDTSTRNLMRSMFPWGASNK